MKMLLIYTLVIVLTTAHAGRSIGVVSDSEYKLMVNKLNNNYNVEPSLRTTFEKSAIVRYYRNKEHLSLRGHPAKLYYKGKEVLNDSLFSKLVKQTFVELKGAGVKTIYHKLKERYIGISRKAVKRVLESEPRYVQKNLKFQNNAPLKHVKSSGVNQHFQVDIVDMKKYQITQNGETYRYILTVMDIFSRFIWLRPLTSKTASAVTMEFSEILEEYGYPKIVQHDQGKEFCGAFKTLLKKKGIRVLRSRPYHPQSQGKIERMHRHLKTKVLYDLKHCHSSGVSWVEQLQKYRRILNRTPKECLGWRSPHDIYFGRGPEGACVVRQKAAKASKSIDARNDRRYNKTLKTPVIKLQSLVYVRVKKPGKVSKYIVLKGTVVNRKPKKSMYLVRYRPCKNRDLTMKWHHISNISIAPDLKIDHKLKYYIVKSKSSDVENLRSDFGFEVRFNPPGDGDCQFAAVANQLQLIGIYRSTETLRADIVSYLRSNSYFGAQRNPWWEYITESRENYLSQMLSSGTYGDHITLQAISEYFNVQILVVSTVNEHTTLITPSGEQVFNDDMPVIVLGHYPENQGEHYVSLKFEAQAFKEVINRSPQIMPEASNCTTRNATSGINADSERNYVETITSETLTENDSNNQFLPNEVLEIIIRMTLAVSPLSRHSLKRVNSFFESIVDQVKPPEIYLNPNLYSNQIMYPISVRKIMQISGKGSSVVAEIKQIIQDKAWTTAWLFLHMVSMHGWYEILRVWYRKLRQ